MEDVPSPILLNLEDIAFYQKTYRWLIFSYVLVVMGFFLMLVLPSPISWIGVIGMLGIVAIPFLNLSIFTDTKHVVSTLIKYNFVTDEDAFLGFVFSLFIPFLGLALIRKLVLKLDKLKIHPQFLQDLKEEDVRLNSN